MTISLNNFRPNSNWQVPALAAAAVAAGSALWVERSSRRAERVHRPAGQFIYIDGTRLHYVLRGQGPAVMLLHGNLVHGADFEASGLVDALARDHQVLVFDRPGFGYSDRPRGRAWTPAAQARLLRHAAQVLGVQGASVVGHSLGTEVALAMALDDPRFVQSLVLVSGYYFPGMRLDAVLAAPTAMPVLGDFLRYTSAALTARAMLGTSVRTMFSPRPIAPAFKAMLPRELLLRPLQQRATSEDGRFMVGQARALRKRYAELRTPTTLIAGAEDRVVNPKSQTERLHKALPDSRLHILPGVGHMAHYEAESLIRSALKT